MGYTLEIRIINEGMLGDWHALGRGNATGLTLEVAHNALHNWLISARNGCFKTTPIGPRKRTWKCEAEYTDMIFYYRIRRDTT